MAPLTLAVRSPDVFEDSGNGSGGAAMTRVAHVVNGKDIILAVCVVGDVVARDASALRSALMATGCNRAVFTCVYDAPPCKPVQGIPSRMVSVSTHGRVGDFRHHAGSPPSVTALITVRLQNVLYSRAGLVRIHVALPALGLTAMTCALYAWSRPKQLERKRLALAQGSAPKPAPRRGARVSRGGGGGRSSRVKRERVAVSATPAPQLVSLPGARQSDAATIATATNVKKEEEEIQQQPQVLLEEVLDDSARFTKRQCRCHEVMPRLERMEHMMQQLLQHALATATPPLPTNVTMVSGGSAGVGPSTPVTTNDLFGCALNWTKADLDDDTTMLLHRAVTHPSSKHMGYHTTDFAASGSSATPASGSPCPNLLAGALTAPPLSTLLGEQRFGP